ncbi:MAG: cyclophilin-like family protein [Archaeoglobaceae archaeon]
MRPASAVNVIGKIVKGIEGLKKVKEGETVFVEEIK